jgi:hypothetical protein
MGETMSATGTNDGSIPRARGAAPAPRPRPAAGRWGRGAVAAGIAALALFAGPAAAQQTYRWQISNGASAGGATTNWSGACGAALDGGSTTRITTMDANAFGCASASVTDSTGGDVQPFHPFLTLVRSASYPSATFVTGGTFLARITGSSTTSGTADVQLGYELSGIFTGFGVPVEQTYSSTTTSTVTINLASQAGTVPAGASLALRVRKLPLGTGQTLTLTLGSSAGNSGTLTVVEKTIAVTAAANPGNSTIGRNGVAPLDAFTLAVSGGPADLSSVSFAGLGATPPVANLFVNASAACTGTTYGTLTAPGASGMIAVQGLTVPSGTTTLYLCMTASATAGTVTGYASAVGATGFAVSGSSSAGTAVTVLQPTIAVAAAGDPGPSSLMELGVAPLDAFTLTVNGGPATVSSVSFSGLGGTASVANVFVNASATCTGTTYGTRAPGTSGSILTPSLTVPTGTTTLYLCMTASASAGTVSGYASTVSASGFAVSGTSSAGTIVTVGNTPPSVAVGAGPNPAGSSIALDVVAPLDEFTLTVGGGPATISYVAFSLGGTLASVANVFVNDAPSCAGTTYGILASPAATGSIPTTRLSAPSGTTRLYLCMTASATAGSVTGYATGVTAPGFPVTGASSAGTTVTVYVPSLAVSAGTNPTGSTITNGSLAPLDAFTLVATGGAVTLRSVSFSLTGMSSIASVSVNDGASCAGNSLGAFPVPDATGSIPTPGLTVPAGTTTLYLCMAASTASGTATGYVTGVSANCAATGTSSAGTTVTVTGTTPSVGPTVSIVNPGNGAVVSSTGTYKVQVRVYDAASVRALTAGSVQLSTNGGTSYGLTAASPNARYTTTNGSASVFEFLVASPAPGAYTLRARAANAFGATVSSPVSITAIAGSGDGNLLVRDNSSQLCSDCHTHQSHGSESLGADYGVWATTCRDCHAPHGTRNVALVRQSIPTPSAGMKPVAFVRKTGDSGAAGLTGSNPTPVASYANSDNSGPCQVCHTKTGGSGSRWRSTGNQDLDHWASSGPSGTATCTASECHSHQRGFGAPESKGRALCRTCHASVANAMAGSASGVTPVVAPKGSRHSLVGYTDSYDDPAGGGNWAGAAALSDIPPAQRSCVNMCHQDHVHNAPGVLGSHAPNVSSDASTQAARAVTRSAQANPDQPDFRAITGPAGVNSSADFDSSKTKGGLCTSCHEKPIASGRPTIARATYAGTAHDFVSNVASTTTYTWQYRIHDGSSFARNCTKCHASRKEGRIPSSGGSISGVHGSDDPRLLAGNLNPGAVGNVAADFVCFSCHGSGAKPAAGAGGDRSGKDVQTVLATKPYYHPVTSDASHDLAAEATATYASGAFTGSRRHANCVDCHDPHAAGKTLLPSPTSPVNSTRNTLQPGSPLTGALGVQFGPGAGTGKVYPALWTVPTATSFSDRPVPSTREYELCFKCHSSFAFGTTPPAVGPGAVGPATDLALEFNPNNRSGHPIVASLQNYTGSSAPRALATTQLLAPWNAAGNATAQTGVGYQTMTCGDCHDADSATPAVQGPHGSAVRFMLKGPNRQWPTQADGVTLWTLTNNTQNLGTANGLFCYNCHPSAAQHTAHSEGGHRSNVIMKCVMCHAVVPHGSKMSRLIVAKTAPAPYRHADIEIERFAKPASLTGYGTGSCRAACYPDHRSANPSETW